MDMGFECNPVEKLLRDEGQDLCSDEKRKYIVVPMSYLNNVCKTLWGMIVILYKGGPSPL
jgi:hypothetical protein